MVYEIAASLISPYICRLRCMSFPKDFLFGLKLKAIATSVVGGILVLTIVVGTYLATKNTGYDFLLNQKVSSSSVLALTFPEPMDHASVEKYLSVPEGFLAEKEWKDMTLLLKPSSPLIPEEKYVFILDADALRTDGTPLGRELRYTFIVTGAPKVAAMIPAADSVNVAPKSEIAIVFDRPMVPLTQVQGRASLLKFKNLPVSISPTPKGNWRWLGTTTLAFEPKDPLDLATKYTVTVPAGIETVAGDKTEQDFSWNFETKRPEVASVSPEAGSSWAGPTTEISLTFTQEMDLQSVKDSLHLTELSSNADKRKEARMSSGATVEDGHEIGIKSVKYGTREEKGETVTDKTVVIATPAKPLAYEKEYALTLATGARGLIGNLGTAAELTEQFRTVGEFTIVRGEYGLEYHYFQIDYSNPVFFEDAVKFIAFSPKVEVKSDDCYVSTYDFQTTPGEGERIRSMNCSPQLEPSTKYTVTIDGLKDVYGQKLAKPYSFTFTTPEYDPQVFIHPRDKRFFSIFEKDKPPVFYINQVNTSVLNIDFGKLPFDKFIELSKSNFQSYEKLPEDLSSVVTGHEHWDLRQSAKKNEWKSIPFDLQKFAGTVRPGLYAMTVKAPEWKDSQGHPYQEERVFALTNMGLTLKYSANKALVWVTDLTTGEPIAGADVKFRALSGKIPLSGKTDAQGFFEGMIDLQEFREADSYWNPEFFVSAEKNGDFAFIGNSWNFGIQAYNFDGISAYLRGPDQAAYDAFSTLYTERPVYGAGDTVYFKGMVRFYDTKGNLSSPPTKTRSTEIIITDPEGKEVYKKTLPFSDFGTFTDSFTTSKDASLGMYGISGRIVPDSDVNAWMYGSFSVLAYRKPEYKIAVAAEKQDYYHGDTVKVNLDAQYFFGAPMSNAKVNWRAYSTDYFFNKYTEGWYSFALEDNWCWSSCDRGTEFSSEGEISLDPLGRGSLSFPVSLEQKGVSQVVTVEADITDENNQLVSNRAATVVHKSDVYVGIRSDDYAVNAGEKTDIKVVTVKPDGSKAESVSVELKLYSRKWNTTSEKGVDGEFYYSSEPEDTYLRSVSVRTDDQGKATGSIELPEGGEYRVVAVAKDSAGRESKAGWSVYAFADTYVNWPRSNNDKMDIVTDKHEYKVGDTAKLLVKTPYQGKGVKALVTIEREDVIEKRVIDVTSNAIPVDVKITEDLVPTAYVSVVVMKPRMGETFNEYGLDTGVPAFKIGYAKLIIDPESKKLDVTIKTDKEKYVPGEKVTVNFETKDWKGKPVPAELSLGVVDMSLLDLTGFSMPDLVDVFYYERGLGVSTANMLVYLMERFKPGSKGGGGDGEDRTRGNFKDTAYWNPTIRTDNNGRASLSFTLPDNLTTWQLLALGLTKDHRFGGLAKTVVETKHVIVRPVRPRFAVYGDKILLGAIVHNYLEADQDFTVSLEGAGFDQSGKSSQTVRVKKDENVKVEFPVTVKHVDQVSMKFSAVTNGAKDVVEEKIPVYEFGVQQTNATSGVTEDQATEKILVPTQKDAPTGTVDVSIAPSVAVYLPQSLAFLSSFPYGCTEQVLSSFVPNLALKELAGFDQFGHMKTADLEKNVQAGLQKLLSFQRSNGGFGYFPASPRSYPYLTAYVLEGFKVARNAGVAVDQRVIDKALSYLKRSVRGADSSGDYDLTVPASRTYILYVLSEYGQSDRAMLSSLFKERKTLPLYAQAHLAMALKNSNMAGNAETLLTEMTNAVRLTARGATFEEADKGNMYYETMNTDNRTTALVLKAMVRIDKDNVLVPKVVRGMLASRQGGHWDTTQSTAQSILSLVEFAKATDEFTYDYQGSAEINGKQVINQRFTDTKMLKKEIEVAFSELPRGKEIDVKVGKQGVGKLYYDLVMSYFYTPDQIEPADEGMGILRETEPVRVDQKELKVGTTQKVTLTITVPETRHFVAVESMLPAGFEPIDLGFATSQQAEYGTDINNADSWDDYWKSQVWRFSHIEFRDDRVFLFADELPAGVYKYEYLVRATVPGTFRERPAKVWEMYNPETFGQTNGGWLEVKE